MEGGREKGRGEEREKDITEQQVQEEDEDVVKKVGRYEGSELFHSPQCLLTMFPICFMLI